MVGEIFFLQASGPEFNLRNPVGKRKMNIVVHPLTALKRQI